MRLRFSSSAFFARPAFIISHTAADARAMNISTCGLIDNLVLRGSLASVWVRSEIQLPTPPVGYGGVELCRREIGMTEHFLKGAEVSAALEQVGGERMPQEVRVHAAGLEPGLRGQLLQNQEGPRPGEAATLRIQEQLRSMPFVQVGASVGEVAAERLGSLAADRHDAFLSALAEHPHEPVVEVDARLVEAHRLRDAQAGAVEQLDQRLVAQRAGRRADGGLDQPFHLAGGERVRQLARAAGP